MSTWRRIETVTRQLELCAVTPGEQIALVVDEGVDTAVAEVFVIVGERLGASLTQVSTPNGPTDRDDPVAGPVMRAALTSAALVIDLTGRVADSSAIEPILEVARVLSIDARTTTDLDTLVAHPGLTRRIERAAELVADGRSAVLSSADGTILDIGLTGATSRAQTVIASETGDHGVWPSGVLCKQPRADIVNGTVIVMPGDRLATTVVRSPIRLEVSGGRVVDLLGDNADADTLRFELERLDPDKPCRVTEVGVGLAVERRTRSHRSTGPEAHIRRAGRCSLTFTGPDTDSAMTMTLTRASFAVDQVDVVVEGDLIGAVAPDVYELAAAD